MKFEKFSSPEENKKSEKSFEEIQKENIKKLFEGNPQELEKRKKEWEKQKTQPIEKKSKEEKTEKKSCIHCGSLEHRSYNCPKLKDENYLKEFMEKLKKKYR